MVSAFGEFAPAVCSAESLEFGSVSNSSGEFTISHSCTIKTELYSCEACCRGLRVVVWYCSEPENRIDLKLGTQSGKKWNEEHSGKRTERERAGLNAKPVTADERKNVVISF